MEILKIFWISQYCFWIHCDIKNNFNIGQSYVGLIKEKHKWKGKGVSR